MPDKLALLGYVLIVSFMWLLVKKKLSALSALVVVPLVVGAIGGFGLQLGDFAMAGIESVASTSALMLFAVLYFSVMISTGMFDPVVNVIVRWIKGDPLKLLVGTAVLALCISLDGDSVTTYVICCTALVPIYDRMKVNKLYLASLAVMANSIPNVFPWGGPTARLLAALNLDAADVMAYMYPALAVGGVYVIVISYIMGRMQRKKVGYTSFNDQEIASLIEQATGDNGEYKRPNRLIFNWVLTIAAVVLLVINIYPAAVLFTIATAIALIVNFDRKTERAIIEKCASDVLPVVSLVMAAGVFMGIISESGMASAIANHLISLIPESMSSHFGFIVSILSVPLLFVSSNDAFYYGIVPVFAETGAAYGFTTLQIGLASLCGQAFRLLSPTVASIYVLLQMTDVNMVEWQIHTAKWAIGIFVIFCVMLFFVLGAVPF